MLPTFLLVKEEKVLETLIGQDVARVKTLVQQMTSSCDATENNNNVMDELRER